MSNDNSPFDSPFKSSLVPELLSADHKFKFRCYKGISCFNACCKLADITLTPYDILRLKQRTGLSSTEVLEKYTVPATADAQGMPAVKMRTLDESPVCVFMKEGEGCSVYEDRPSACRYYPLGLVNMRRADSNVHEQHYAIVREDHCRGHDEDNELTIADYRKEQGVEEYDEHDREWYEIIVKKCSAGPAIGNPSRLSFQMFFMASYDIDRFRRFVLSDSFRKTYDVPESDYAVFATDDLALLKFGYKLMKQVFFNEKSIPEREGAVEQRQDERKGVYELRKQAAVEEWKKKNDVYAIDKEVAESEKKK
jgi:Fe-S-cluster containining protein